LLIDGERKDAAEDEETNDLLLGLGVVIYIHKKR
jgi:hypothetical protein